MHRINLPLHLRTGTIPIAVRPERRGPFRSEVEFAQPAFTENVAPYIVRRVFCAPCLILSFSLSCNAKQTPLNLLWPRYRKETMLFKVLYLLSLLLFDPTFLPPLISKSDQQPQAHHFLPITGISQENSLGASTSSERIPNEIEAFICSDFPSWRQS
jgi:hypothetical protein